MIGSERQAAISLQCVLRTPDFVYEDIGNIMVF